jgi:hypothetical protein
VGTPEVASTALRTERAEPFRDVKGKEVRPARPAVLAAFWKACVRLVHPRGRKEQF